MKLDPFYIPTCHPDETLTSYCSRVAALHTCSLRDLCSYKELLDYRGICSGAPAAVADLSRLVGFENGLFPGVKTTATGKRMFEINGEQFTRASLRRAQIRVCPHCLQEDHTRDIDHPVARHYGRVSWTIASIRTCSKHNTALVVAAFDDSPSQVHDFSKLVTPFISKLDQHVASVTHRTPSDLETYLENRIKGNRLNLWISSLPAYAAARACEIIGATKLHGAQVSAESLTEDQWYEAGQAGFEITVQGANGFRGYLDDMQQTFAETRHAWGPRQIYGRFYEWLAHETDDTAYDKLREIITEHAFKTLPMGPDDEIFGRRPEKRTLHSVHTAHLETGAHPKRLKKVLHAVGLIDEAKFHQSDERILFRADEADFYLKRIGESMSLNCVRAYINAPRPVERALFKEGILKPWLQGGTGNLKDHAFAKRDLDEFLSALTTGAVPTKTEEKNLVPILRAVKMANCSTPEVVQLILDGRLETVRTDPEQIGFLSLRVDPDEIKPLVRREDHGGYSLREVEKKLKTSTKVVKALIHHRHLEAETAVNPINRCPQVIVKREILEAFMNKFETASSLSRRSEIHLQTLMKRLKDEGVGAAFSKEQIPATFYALDEVRSVDPGLFPDP